MQPWFKHDYHARHDQKLTELRQKCGYEGLGIFWCLLEIMCENASAMLLYNKCSALAYDLNIQEETLKKVIDTCIEIELFKKDDDTIFSERLQKDRAEYQLICAKRKHSANKRWSNASALQKQCKSNAIRLDKIRLDKKRIDKASPSALPLSFFKTILPYWILSYKKQYGVEPAVAFGKEGKIVNAVRGLFKNDQEWQSLINDFLNSQKAKELGATLAMCFSTHTISLWQQNKLDTKNWQYGGSN